MNYALVIAYALALAAIGILAARRKGLASYLIADRDIGALQIGCSVSAGFFDGFVLVSYTGFVYTYGWPALSLFIGIAVGFLLFSFFATKLRREAADNGYYGMSDYFEQRYGHTAAVTVSVFNVIFYEALLLIQFLFGSAILQDISGWSYPVCIILIGLMLLSYVTLGGFRAVLTTDVFQWILIAAIVVFFFPYFLRSGAVRGAFRHADFAGSTETVVGFLIIGCMGVFSAPELWQRSFGARDDKSIRGGLIIAGLMLPVIGVILAAIGFAARGHYPGLAPQSALVRVFRGMLPSSVEALGLLLLLSAVMSTADTALFIIAPSLSINVLRLSEKRGARRATAVIIVITVAIAVVLGLVVRNVLDVAFSLAGMSIGLFPILLGGLIWRLHPKVVVVSLLLGLASVLVLIVAGEIRPETSVISFPVVLLSLLLGSAWVKWRARRATGEGS
ncbi:sodium:solute symporter [Planctomycetota bacterium]